MMKEQHKKLIQELGGSAAVAELCEVSVSAVSQWIADYGQGIPRARLLYLNAIRPKAFKRLGIDIKKAA